MSASPRRDALVPLPGFASAGFYLLGSRLFRKLIKAMYHDFLRLDVLPEPQRALWPELAATPPMFTLYGGTALALQLGHRVSIDFDFFALEPINPHKLLAAVPYLKDATVLRLEPDTLTCRIGTVAPVNISFFGVPNLKRLVEPLLAPDIRLPLANIRDIAGTKAITVQSRATAKDYIDVDAILRLGGLTLADILACGAGVFGAHFQPMATLKALSYFEDVPDLPADVQTRLAKAARLAAEKVFA